MVQSDLRHAVETAAKIPCGRCRDANLKNDQMKSQMAILLITLACAVQAHAQNANAPPPDVRRYIKAAETCQHLAGEYDGELALSERKQIERNIRKYCGSAKRQMAVLNAKYSRDTSVQKILAAHQYDAVTSYIR